MSGYVIEIPQENTNEDMLARQLRVAAYCRVSTTYEEQKHSLDAQIRYYSQYIQQNLRWKFVAVYADQASGLHTKNRPGYQQMLRDCRRGKIDLILVKTLSRFGRDALETISQIRRLKEMNIGVYVESANMNTLSAPEFLVSMCAARDQAESQSRSSTIKFGIQQRMRSGKAILNHTQFLGYTKGADGVLKIVPEEAEVVRKIFDLYVQGNGVRRIKRYLEENGIKTVTGKAEWSTSTIDRMLSNEKYIGQVLMQKSYTPDYLTGKQEKNHGERRMYLVENAHEAIIDREIFERVQEMKGHSKKNASR